MMRLDKVKEIAREHTANLKKKKEDALHRKRELELNSNSNSNSVVEVKMEEIEIEMAFQIGVRQNKLALPGSTQDMLYRRTAGVTDQNIATAVNAVNTYCSGENFQAYLDNWDPWKKYQYLQQKVVPFKQLPLEECDAPIELCSLCSENDLTTHKMARVRAGTDGENDVGYHCLVKSVVETKIGKDPFTGEDMNWENVARLIEKVRITEGEASSAMDTDNEGAVTAHSGNTVESRKRPLHDSSDTAPTPRKQAEIESSTIGANRAVTDNEERPFSGQEPDQE